MKELAIIGAGLGLASLSAEGNNALAAAEVWFGAERLLSLYEPIKGERKTFPYYQGEAILREIEGSAARSFAILVSGDPGFFSAASALAKDLAAYNPRVIPGISSLSALFARLGRSYERAVMVSAHGRDIVSSSGVFVGAVRRNRETFCLAGANAASMGKALVDAGFGSLTIQVGENLGSAAERVYPLSGEALSTGEFPPMTALLAVNENPDSRIRHGIPDDEFIRAEGIPMTKSAIRSLALSKLALQSGDVAWDVGAGTGSVSVEMALAAYRGRVYAAEREEAGITLIEENRKRFHIGNIAASKGSAPEVLADFPPPDAVFIGGSGGRENLLSIIAAARSKNSRARIVATAITLETAGALLEALPQASLTQIFAADGRKAGKSRLLIGQNPVMIISDNGEES